MADSDARAAAGPPPRLFDDETLVQGAAVAARLYVLAALDEVEAAVREVEARIRAIRAKYTADLRGADPFTLLLTAEKVYRSRRLEELKP